MTPKKYGVEAVREKTPAWTFAKSSDVAFGKEASQSNTASQLSQIKNEKSQDLVTSPKKRFKQKNKQPGPGAYNIPGTIGMIAQFYRADHSALR